jgi:hypothetical protein
MSSIQNDANMVRLLLNKKYEIPPPQPDKVESSSTAVRRGVLRKVSKPQKAGMKRSNSRRVFTLGKKKRAKTDSDEEEDEEEEEEEDSEQDTNNQVAADIEVINDNGELVSTVVITLYFSSSLLYR